MINQIGLEIMIIFVYSCLVSYPHLCMFYKDFKRFVQISDFGYCIIKLHGTHVLLKQKQKDHPLILAYSVQKLKTS